MQLTYRGNRYETSETKSTPVERVIKLIYRGHTYEYKPQSMAYISAECEADLTSIDLVYRGHTYTRKQSAPQDYMQPRALNWRWQ